MTVYSQILSKFSFTAVFLVLDLLTNLSLFYGKFMGHLAAILNFHCFTFFQRFAFLLHLKADITFALSFSFSCRDFNVLDLQFMDCFEVLHISIDQ